MEDRSLVNSHRHLPHIDIRGVMQFITWRCADSLPLGDLERICMETESLPDLERTKERASRIEKVLDLGYGKCPLAPNRHGAILRDIMLDLDGDLMDLHDWIIMPNHVHILMTVRPGHTLSETMQRIKGASARAINQQMGTAGSLWQQESFDRFMRDDEQASRVAYYIRYNPVKAKLVDAAEAWPLSSARRAGPHFVRESRAPYGDEFDPFLD